MMTEFTHHRLTLTTIGNISGVSPTATEMPNSAACRDVHQCDCRGRQKEGCKDRQAGACLVGESLEKQSQDAPSADRPR